MYMISNIVDGNQEKRFKLDSDTGVITIHRMLGFGHSEYLLAVEAMDTSSNLTATTKVCQIQTTSKRSKLWIFYGNGLEQLQVLILFNLLSFNGNKQ